MRGPDLASTAQALVADGKGILAADETVPTITTRLEPLGLESTPDTRRAYRMAASQDCGPVSQMAGSAFRSILFGIRSLRQRVASPEIIVGG